MKTTEFSASDTSMGCLVLNVALGEDGKRVQRTLERYLKTNGMEWTCKRQKAIWNIALLLKQGSKDQALQVCRENSIAHHRSGIPKGIEGLPVKRFVEAQRPQVLKRLSAALRWYTSLTLPGIVPSQIRKAKTTICGPSESLLPKADVYRLGIIDGTLAMARLAKARMGKPFMSSVRGKNPQFDSALEKIREEFRNLVPKVVYADSLSGARYYYSRSKPPKGQRGVPYSHMAMSLMCEPYVPQSVDQRTPCFELREAIRNSGWPDQKHVGRIWCIQEQGCKARIVAQPTAWLQLAFVPVHMGLERIADRLFPDSSCVHDQTNGAYQMHSAILRGQSVYSTDLSSATDRFPREYSLGILHALGLYDWEEAFREVCSKDWDFTSLSKGTTSVRYEVGQPMGLYGSFPLFHLSNMCLALGSQFDRRDLAQSKFLFNDKILEAFTKRPLWYSDQNTFHNECCFVTLGDDIVHSSHEASQRYRDDLSLLGVPTSPSKCYSGRVGEFAGFVCIKTNKGAAIYRPYKVPDVPYPKNPIQFLEALGSSVRDLKLSHRNWGKIWDIYSTTRGARDIALEAYVSPNPEDIYVDRAGVTHFVRRQTANRIDSPGMRTLCNVLVANGAEAPYQVMAGDPHINRVPLFLERGPLDYYGYNPGTYLDDEASRDRTDKPYRRVIRSLSQDPLFQEAMDKFVEKERQSNEQMHSRINSQSAWLAQTPVGTELQHASQATSRPSPVTPGRSRGGSTTTLVSSDTSVIPAPRKGNHPEPDPYRRASTMPRTKLVHKVHPGHPEDPDVRETSRCSNSAPSVVLPNNITFVSGPDGRYHPTEWDPTSRFSEPLEEDQGPNSGLHLPSLGR